MTDHDQHLINSIENFYKKFINLTESQTGSLPRVEFNPRWNSPCLKGNSLKPDMQKTVCWQPLKREENNDLAGIETALDIQLHPDIKIFFCTFWSDHINANFQHGNLTLLFVWNSEDMENLIKNQLGHALDKKRNHLQLSFFIACTDSDFIISIENSTGHIVLERPGSKPEKVLAASLSDFFDELEPGTLS